ncbi:unnamed protein product [Rotaria sp. Silwood2]|nr:unnamed protein product [Rotaria sp. Silwood2]CAF4192263.1 unnamed protein product [Rotaria sp. Silwood2]
MTAVDYCYRVLEKLTLTIEALQPVLSNLTIPAKIGDSYLKTLKIPSLHDVNINAQEPLKILANFFQVAVNILPSFRQINNTDDYNNAIPMGQELNETSEKTIAEPSEQNGCHLNGEMQAIIPSNLPAFSIPKDICTTISLSQLLLQAQEYVQKLKLTELKIYEQPQEFWKKRSINCLKNKWCPAIQGRSGKQRHYIGIKWSKLHNSNANNLFVLVQLLSHDNQSHQSKVLVPPETIVKQSKLSGRRQKRSNRRQTLNDLIIKDIYGFNKATNTILCPITEDEYCQCKKNLKLIMFSLYKTYEEIENSNYIQDSYDNQKEYEDEDEDAPADEDEDTSIENQLLKLCKLRIRLCRRTSKNTLEYISNCIDTELIEESKGNQTLSIDQSQVTPQYLCKCGNEIIVVPLNTDSEKNGFTVRLNDTQLNSSQIHGVKGKHIFFKSLPDEIPRQNFLRVMVSKKSVAKTIKQNHNPYDGIDENTLLNLCIRYVENSDNLHHHKNDEYKISMQTNEINRINK